MGISRRVLIRSAAVIGVGSVAGLIPRSAGAAEFTIKLGNNVPDTHPTNVALTKAADRIARETAGRVELRLFPNNALGGDTDMLSQVRSGALEAYMLSPLVSATLVPLAAISGLGFAFKDYDALWAAMDGEVGTLVRGEYAKINLVAMPRIFDNGFRQITTSGRPVHGPADLKGLKIRVPVSPMWTSLFKALGTSPISINFAELYSALQTKLAEAQENPLSIIQVGKLYEVQKYLAYTNHMWDGFWCVMNKARWDALPKELQGVVERNVNLAADEQRKAVRTLNESLQGELESKGMLFNKVDVTPFRDAIARAGFYAEWQGKFGADSWALLEKFTGKLV
ncbi:TRAP transporter substrate-binding protein [Bradyrhizobium roseum]|uniref:TRAP transporter substrate-binding protein n=1 Tax=Bradyrhizobium roseum TaxID=3056648 RepID=UPI0026281F11|nr:TRAP transporter substrate-binding protein [Bradyrhizobium roseus]WKA26482.1 TRAP transporter substrate-binding protein [Bradyrhizobium roseus]